MQHRIERKWIYFYLTINFHNDLLKRYNTFNRPRNKWKCKDLTVKRSKEKNNFRGVFELTFKEQIIPFTKTIPQGRLCGLVG